MFHLVTSLIMVSDISVKDSIKTKPKQTLTKLNIGGNNQITSVSPSTIAELIKTTTSMIELHLYHTLLNDEDIKSICKSLIKNMTTQTLYLPRRHEDICKNLDSYEIIKNRLKFW